MGSMLKSILVEVLVDHVAVGQSVVLNLTTRIGQKSQPNNNIRAIAEQLENYSYNSVKPSTVA